MATNAKDITPARAIHPGNVLKSELQARGIRQKDFATSIGMPASNLSELVKGKRNITESIAIKLEKALGIPFQTWMNLQNRYYYIQKCREQLDTAEATATLEEQSLKSRLNLPFIYKYYGIETPSSATRVSMLKQNLSIDLSKLQNMEVNTIGFFKRSDILKVDEVNMRTWLLLAWSEAAKSDIDKPYTAESGLKAASEISKAANEGILTSVMLKDILNNNGIIFCHIPVLNAAPIDAYSVKIGGHPAIAATYRHNDMDKLAFDVLHEIGHILQHLTSEKSYIKVEHDYSSQSTEERQADEFANNTLIAPDIWKSIMSSGSNDLSSHTILQTIARESRKHGISPTIAIARYRQETYHSSVCGYRPPKIS